jgi:hypothetical protein
MAVTPEMPAGATAIRPFKFEVSEAEIEELRARIAATRWPERGPSRINPKACHSP